MKIKNKTKTESNPAPVKDPSPAALDAAQLAFLGRIHQYGKHRLGPFLMGVRNEGQAEEIAEWKGKVSTYIAQVESPAFDGEITFEHISFVLAASAIADFMDLFDGQVVALEMEH